MKRIIKSTLFISLILTGTISYGQSKQEIKAPISSVKVFLNAAMINHQQKVKIKPGINNLKFTGIASNIQKEQITLTNYGNAELLSLKLITITDTTDLLNAGDEILESFGSDKDSILSLEKQIWRKRFEMQSLEMERNMLIKNDDIIPNLKLASTAEFRTTTQYYRERLHEVNMDLLLKRKEMKLLSRKKTRMLQSSFDVKGEDKETVAVNILMAQLNNAASEYTTDLALSYVAQESGWIPEYQVIASSSRNLKLIYRARVLNNTGVNWNDVNLVISTADPFQYYAAPDLDPWYIDRYNRLNKAQMQNANQFEQQQQKQQYEEIFVPEREITFNIAKKYSSLTGMTPFFIDVTSYDLTPEFLYRTAPKKEEQVYQIGRIRNWESLNLVDGEAQIYFDGKLLGKSYIRPSDLEEYLEFPLGVVDKIFVKYRLVSEYSSKKALANEIVATFNYEIKLKNNASEKVNLEVMDQVPVSGESGVKVEVLEMSDGGEKEAESGKIFWRLELGANSDKTLALKYSVTYPKRKGYGTSQAYSKNRYRSKF